MNTKISIPSFTGTFVIPNNRQSKKIVDSVKFAYSEYTGETGTICNYKETFNAIFVKFFDITNRRHCYTDTITTFINHIREQEAEKLFLRKIIKDEVPYYYAKDTNSLDLTRDSVSISNIAHTLNEPLKLTDVLLDIDYYRH
ncbi:MAG: hypothetical protein PHC34_10805 [Candidatus Gastranaerophilales bacterium]|nr:hypothetical protein [Candidatus Gastranaerophilales bacterium]